MSASQTQVPPQFDAATQAELREFIDVEQAKAKLQASVHELTDRCWNLCITGGISSKFSKGEAACLENCVDRFLDTSMYIVKQIEEQRKHL